MEISNCSHHLTYTSTGLIETSRALPILTGQNPVLNKFHSFAFAFAFEFTSMNQNSGLNFFLGGGGGKVLFLYIVGN